MTLSVRIAAFTSGLETASLPADVEELARVCLLNAYGIALCGLDTPYAPVARRAVLAMDGEVPGGATLLGDGRRTTIAGAALANGALFHGRAQEDTCGAGHFGTVLIPLLTAIIEARGLGTGELIPALVAGYEAGGLAEKALARRTTPNGFRSTTLYGTIAAAAATARLMRMDVKHTASAIENSASFTGGILQSFADGTDEWRYQPGIVARNGWAAAELARAGSVSAPRAFEGRSGLARAFAQAEIDVDALAAQLGRDWSIRRVTFKPHPVCAFNQTPVTAALALHDQVAVDDIAAVRVRMNPFETGYAGMDATGPFQSISGTLMSIPFCIATTLLHGAPSMVRMTTYDDAAVNALEGRITLVSDDSVPTLSAVIEVDRRDGGALTHRQSMVETDYQFSRPDLLAMLKRIGAQQGLAGAHFDRIDAFTRALPDAPIEDVISIFPRGEIDG
jgi:2-methylcitrate dehydratase PrpD